MWRFITWMWICWIISSIPLCDGTNCALSTDLSVCQTSNVCTQSGGTLESCPDTNYFISGELCYKAATNDECELGELACT